MRCSSCDAELVPGKKFCPACGASVVPRCRGCGAELQPEFRFCPDCGRPVSAEHDAAPPPAPEDPFARLSRGIPETLAQKVRAARGAIEGERKQVTVLFCDLAGSTAIAEKMDPEEYHDLLEEYLALAFHEIYRFEGIVNQLAGDGMMALFGAPVAHEDAPRRAVGAALAIHEALGELNERLRARGIELRARIGIHTGPVVVGTVGNDLKMDYTAIGDTTNAAARLESLAGPGGVLISEATYRLVRGFFDVRPAGSLEVKGRREPVVAYEVLAHAATASPMAIALARGLTPFVGRREELNLLKACFRRLSGTGAQVVAVVGEAGSGKSRLLYEFRRRLALEGTVFFEGRCSSMSQTAPYHPFLSMFRQYFDLVPGESHERACEKVSKKVGVAFDHIVQMYPVLCQFLSLHAPGAAELPAAELKQESFDGLARLVLEEAEKAPVVMTIEDLHWIDEASHELLENLISRLSRARVLVIVSERPEANLAWRGRVPFTQLVVPRLTDDDVAGIIRAIAGGALPRALEQRLVAKAEGSPFFAEEMTRGLLEEGYLVREANGVRVTQAVEAIAVPGTVQEVLAARLDRLDGSAKRVIQVAAVLGRQFSASQLATLLADEGIEVPRALDDLEQRGLVHRKSALSVDEYRFGESLTQEVAYEGLLHKQRRQLHERVALLLETTPADGAERSALLAHHFLRSDDRAKAIEACLRAAQDADRLPSYGTAAKFYRKAWDVAEGASGGNGIEPAFRRQAMVATLNYCRLASVFGSGDPELADRAAARCRELAEALGDTEALASVTYSHGVIIMLGDPQRFAEGLALAEQGLAQAREARLELTTLRISQGLGIVYALDGRFDLARHAVGYVIDSLIRAGHQEPPSDLYLGARWIYDNVLLMSDDLDAAIAHATETHALALRAPNRTVRGGSATVLAQVYFLRGDYTEALRWADESLEIGEAIASVAALAGVAGIALASRIELGARVEADRYLDAIDRGLASGDTLQTNARFVAAALVALGDLGRIERHVGELQRLRSGGRLRQAFVANALGTVLARLERCDEAQRSFARALALGSEIGGRSVIAAAALGAADVAAGRGDQREERRLRDQGLALATELGLGRYLTRATSGRPVAAGA